MEQRVYSAPHAWGAQSSQTADVGIGLKPEFFHEILTQKPAIGFFEIHAENYMVAGGPFHDALTKIRADYPLSIHGVGLSLGGSEPLDTHHLAQLKILIDRYEPTLFSEHLAWCRYQGQFLNDLLPLPYTQASLAQVCDHIDQTQSFLKRQLLIENPATYLTFENSTFDEPQFIREVIKRTGCGLLLDVNNVHVSAFNHGWNAHAYIDSIDLNAVQEIHLAGFSQEKTSDDEWVLIDSHGADIAPDVWELYRYTISKTGLVPTLIERDQNIPPFQELLNEVSHARALRQEYQAGSTVV